jgi:hypothetical protein
MEHNFGIALWKIKTDRAISTPVAMQAKHFCIERSSGLNVLYTDHDTVNFS